MWPRIFAGIFAVFGLVCFLRAPTLDTAILVLPVLMLIAVSLEDIWGFFKKPDRDPGPRCPQCDYDVRATPIRCPECGLILDREQNVNVDNSLPAARL